MLVLSHNDLLADQHVDKGRLVLRAFQRLEHLFLGLGHRAPDAMTLAPELAHIDAR